MRLAHLGSQCWVTKKLGMIRQFIEQPAGWWGSAEIVGAPNRIASARLYTRQPRSRDQMVGDIPSPRQARTCCGPAKLRAELRAPIEAAKARAQKEFENQHNFAATIDHSKDTSCTALLTQCLNWDAPIDSL